MTQNQKFSCPDLFNDDKLESADRFFWQVAENDEDQLRIVDDLGLDVSPSDDGVRPKGHDRK